MPTHERSSLSQRAVAAAFYGFKAFMVMGALVSGIDLLVEIGTQLIAEGVCALGRRKLALGEDANNNNHHYHHHHHHHSAGAAPNHDTYAGAVESMVYAYGSVERFQREVTDFAQFSRELSWRLTQHGDVTSGGDMATVGRVYLQFVECDLDGSGDVSIEEFITFCSKMDVSRESAMTKFFRADVNSDGRISFEEWTAMMMGRVGRAENGLNCGGNHGLARYTAPIHGMSCSFCENLIPAGSVASGCRLCNCDACSSCSGLSQLPPCAPPSSFDGSVRQTSSLSFTGAVNGLNCRCSRGLLPFTTRVEIPCTWCPTLLSAGSPAVGCRACDMDGCMDCVAGSLEARCASALNCRGRHGLTKTQVMTREYACEFCRTVIPGGTTIYGCRTCQVASCVTCMWTDHRRALPVSSSTSGAAFSCPGNHQLRTLRVFGYQQLGHTCKWCLKAPSLHEHILRCHVCDVNVCNACQEATCASAQPALPAPATTPLLPLLPAPATTPLLPPLPPSYGQFITQYNRHGGATSPLPRVPSACAGGAQAPNPPRYPEQKQLAIAPPAESPFRFGSVVRVLSLEDDDSRGKLMTVIGFEPSGQGQGGHGGGEGEVVLNCWGKVVRAPSFMVIKLNDIKC